MKKILLIVYCALFLIPCAFFSLGMLIPGAAVSAEGVTLTWSNGWGQIYAILGSNDLEHWTEIEHTGNWDDAIGGIPSFRDTRGLVENEEFVSFDTGYKFFKLRIKQR